MQLKPSAALRPNGVGLIAADAGTLAPAMNANHVHLIKVPFVPDYSTTFNSMNEATFTGGAAKSAGTGTQPNFRDPVTGNFVIDLKEPAGGWVWICTADPVSPETIYGVIITDNADAVTLGSGLLDNPVTISASGDAVDVGDLQYLFASDFMG